MDNLINETKQNMEKVISNLEARLQNVRAGRANPAMLNGITVDYYGTQTPLNALATITVPEARQLHIRPFDKSSLKDIDKAIYEANLGIAPTNNGEIIILTIPALTEERRKEYVKEVKQMGEEGKVGIRQAREESRNMVKKEELPEDDADKLNKEIQELTDSYNKMIDEILKSKEKELMTV